MLHWKNTEYLKEWGNRNKHKGSDASKIWFSEFCLGLVLLGNQRFRDMLASCPFGKKEKITT